MERSKVDVPHGVTGYRNYGCRCDICRLACTELKRRKRISNLIPVQPLIDKFGEDMFRRFPKMMAQWQREGISIYAADKICCARGFHPVEIYGDDWFEPAWEKMKNK